MCSSDLQGKTPMYMALDGEFLGVIAVADTVKEESIEAIRELKGENRTSVKQIHVSHFLFACDLFSSSLADSIILLTLTRLVVVFIFVNFSFALFTPL